MRGTLATGRIARTGPLVVVLLCAAAPSALAALPELDTSRLEQSAPILPELDPKKLLGGGLDPVGELTGGEVPGIGGDPLPPGGDGGGGDPPGSTGSGETPSGGGGDASSASGSGGDASVAGGSPGSAGDGSDSRGGRGSGDGSGGGERVRPGDIAAATPGPPAAPASARAAKGDPAGELEDEGVSEVVRLVREIPAAVLIALVAAALAALVFAAGLLRERRRFRRAERDALHDPLTGLPNRLAFDHAIAIDWARAIRYERPLAVLMLDLDGLKRINDEHGHAAGDRALRATAAALSTRLRRSDVAARLSGDEFVVLTTETHGEELRRLAGELRRALAEVPIDVSVGWAERTGADVDSDQLLHRADMAMYEEKYAKRARAPAGVGLNGHHGAGANGHCAGRAEANGSAKGNGRPSESPLADPSAR